MRRPLLLLELNEINFEYVSSYCDRGELPTFARLIRECGLARTVSEQRHEELEPWIQWVTAHTGMTLAEHGVFRLGDIVRRPLPQIWEELEDRGLRVGAVSPMNASNRLRDAAFFVPDPWTPTRASAPPRLARLYEAIAEAVNENAQARLTLRAAWRLVVGLATYARPRNYLRYLGFMATGLRRPWRRALLLDLLLADVFAREVARTRPDFATLFLNAGAHIQHHYLFSSACYAGPHRNPAWYAPPGLDPVLEAYRLYDGLLAQLRTAFPEARLMIATGLHQDPHPEQTWYWRLRDHARFLRQVGVPFARVEPRMSRDFLVVCHTAAEAAEAERRLRGARAADGLPLFEVDNRGSDLFVMLTYPREIGPGFAYTVEGATHRDLDRDVAFVALKNGEHNGIGYFIDTGAAREALHDREFALAEIPDRIREAFGLGRRPGPAPQAALRSA